MRLVLFQFVFLIFSQLNSQSFSEALPKIGDVQYTCEHLSKVEPFMVEFGTKNFWDFNYLTSYWSIKETYVNAKTSKYYKYFPSATLCLLKSLDEEEFFKVKDGSLFSLGRIKFANYKYKIPEIIIYSPEKRIVNTTKKVGSTFENIYSIQVKIGKIDLSPDYKLLLEKYDSLYLEISIKENVKVSDEGQLMYGNTSKNSQKQEVTVSQTIKPKVKMIKDKSWLPFVNFDINDLPEDLRNLYKGPKSSRIDYISPSFKGLMLTYENSNKLIGKITYQDTEPSPYMRSIDYDSYDVIASPNPTTGNITLRLFNYPYDSYIFEIYNLVGKKIYSKTYSKVDGRNLKADVSNLKRGTYMYSVLDSKGKKMMTKRISLIGI